MTDDQLTRLIVDLTIIAKAADRIADMFTFEPEAKDDRLAVASHRLAEQTNDVIDMSDRQLKRNKPMEDGDDDGVARK